MNSYILTLTFRLHVSEILDGSSRVRALWTTVCQAYMYLLLCLFCYKLLLDVEHHSDCSDMLNDESASRWTEMANIVCIIHVM